MGHKPVNISVSYAARLLKIREAEAEAARELGLIEPAEGGRVTRDSVMELALTPPEDIAQQVKPFVLVNLTEAGELLDTTPARVKRALISLRLPYAKQEKWRHGTVNYWRTETILGPVSEEIKREDKTNPHITAGKKPAITRGNIRIRSTKDRNTATTPQPVENNRDFGRKYRNSPPSDNTPTNKAPSYKAPVLTDEGKQLILESQHTRIRVLEPLMRKPRVTLHAGPTNSGKTYAALSYLKEARRGVYAGPLRMLAREAYDKLRADLGDDMVGMVTGEEQINPDAPILCCTAEAAPLYHGGTLIIDEAHWISDGERGWAWTRLLVAGDYENIQVICDEAAVPAITTLLPDAAVMDVQHHERLSPVKFGGQIPYTKMPEGSAIVVFSRVAVHALYQDLADAGRKPVMMYGALPPSTRLSQVQALVSGDADIIVTTDVIGHGINLPLTAVALAETEKYDGKSRRKLHLWEAAQILGRAGRYGLAGSGQTFSVTGKQWFTSNPSFIGEATKAAAGLSSTRWRLDGKAPLRPTLGELGTRDLFLLPQAVRMYSETVARAAELIPLQLFDETEVHAKLIAMLTLLSAYPESARQHVTIDDVWALATCPVDDATLISCVLRTRLEPGSNVLQPYIRQARSCESSLLQAETAARQSRSLRSITTSVGSLPDVSVSDAAAWEAAAARSVSKYLASGRIGVRRGRCSDCGKQCPPWFDTCENCHTKKRWERADDWDW